MWSNDFEGEAFLQICKLPGVHPESRTFEELKQFELALTHPKSEKRHLIWKLGDLFFCLAHRSRIMDVLEERSNDKIALDFVRRRRETENQ